jgi:uncharacterized protein (TIGR03067 family)
MTRLALLSLGCLLLISARTTAADDKDYEPFQGKWTFVSVVVNGNEQPAAQFEKSVLTVKGNERVIHVGDEVKSRAKYKVDATKTPKTIDIEVLEGSQELKGKTFPGIYELKDDTMTVIFRLQGERPGDFTCKPDSGRVLQKFKRLKDK